MRLRRNNSSVVGNYPFYVSRCTRVDNNFIEHNVEANEEANFKYLSFPHARNSHDLQT